MLDRVAIFASPLRTLCCALLVWAGLHADVVTSSVSTMPAAQRTRSALASELSTLFAVPACTPRLLCADTIGWLIRENAVALVAPPGAMRTRTPGLHRRYLMRDVVRHSFAK